MAPANQTDFSRGVIWSTHIVIDIDLFQGTCILFVLESPEYRVDIGCATIPYMLSLILFNMILYLVTLKLAERVYKGDT